MLRKIGIIFIIFCALVFGQEIKSENYHYVVNYIMMPSLNMDMEIRHDFPEKGSNQIDIYTKTKSFFNKIFAIDNHYISVFDGINYTIKHHKKIINQPNVEQILEIDYIQNPIRYSNGEIRDNDDEIYDFFSMLMYLRTVPRDSLEISKILVDMEGEFFEATFAIEEEELIKVGKDKIPADRIKIIYQKPDQDQLSVLDYTDIFFWKIASESGNKYIWLEKNNKRRILKARFSEGRHGLEAQLIEGK